MQVLFDICGAGSALDALKRQVRAQGLEDIITVHGRVERSNLLNIYANSHAVIVPTRSDFTEGIPQICAEAMLCDLPVITSKVTNAFDVLGRATIQAITDNIDSYVEAILALINDRSLYEKTRSECQAYSIQFTDRSQSFPAAVDRLVERLFPLKRAMDCYDSIFEQIA